MTLATHNDIREDYESFLSENGLSQESIEDALRKTDVDLMRCDKVFVGDSAISGKGVFASGHILEGDAIATVRAGGKWTMAGRYTNHSPVPNAMVTTSSSGSFLMLIALHNINPNDEIMADYRQVKRAMEEKT